MNLSPVIGPEVPEAANGVASPDSPELCGENGPSLGSALSRQALKRRVRAPLCPGRGEGGSEEAVSEEDGPPRETDRRLGGEAAWVGADGHTDTVAHNSRTHAETHATSPPHTPPARPAAKHTPDAAELCAPPTDHAPHSHQPPDGPPSEDAQSQTAAGSPAGGPPPPLEGALGAEGRHGEEKRSEGRHAEEERSEGRHAEVERSETDRGCSGEDGRTEMEGEKEKQDEEEDEKREQHAGNTQAAEEEEHPPEFSSVAAASGSAPPPAPPPADSSSPCPPHVMAQVRVRNVPERERLARGGMQDSKSLDEISQACGGGGVGGGAGGGRAGGRGGQAEGRRATISSALELEGTVSHDGDLTHFITRNLEQKIKLSSKPSLDCDSDCSGPIHRGRGSRRPADIPPIDPSVLLDLERHTQEVAHSVEMMMRSLNGTIQNMTALSVGYIQTYRDSVDSLGESVDMSIKGMYTLMARCEELDRSMQPIHTLAAQIRDIKRTLDTLEAICK